MVELVHQWGSWWFFKIRPFIRASDDVLNVWLKSPPPPPKTSELCGNLKYWLVSVCLGHLSEIHPPGPLFGSLSEVDCNDCLNGCKFLWLLRAPPLKMLSSLGSPRGAATLAFLLSSLLELQLG